MAEPEQGRLALFVRLYPIVTDNKKTDYQSRFVTDGEYLQVRDLLAARSGNPGPMRFGRDDTGCYLELQIQQSGAGTD